MIVEVDPGSAVPVFEQLRSQIERLILAGQLEAGHQLPAIRHLAADLGLARGTVAKVYEVLARDGLVVADGRHGTVVAARPAPQHARHVQTTLAEAVGQLALLSRQLGVGAADVHAALDEALGAPLPQDRRAQTP